MKKESVPFLVTTLLSLLFSCSNSHPQVIFFPENVGSTTEAPNVSSAPQRIASAASKDSNQCDKLCIPLDLCPSLFELLENPSQRKIKLLQGRSCGFSPSGDPLVWCDEAICKDRSLLPKPELNKTIIFEERRTSSSTEPNQGNNDISLKIGTTNIRKDIPVFTPPPPASPAAFTSTDVLCGTTLLSRIHGGEKAAREEFPWIIALAVGAASGPQIICGGALISDEWVITAAHCVVDSQRRLRNISHIRVGAYDLSKSEEDGAENVKVKSIFYHHQFSDRPVIKNDIALLKLQKRVSYSVTVGTICLPGAGGSYSNLPLYEARGNRKGIIAGWGGNGEQQSFNILQKVEIPLIPINSCMRSLMRLRVRVIPQLQICGGTKNRDSCKGDSGGPLMVTEDGRVTLIGIISYGTIQCDGGLPGVYTRVSSYVNWVTETMLNNTR